MTNPNKVIYVPALRMKTGELEGLRCLRIDVANCVVPFLIIPPAKERDSGSQAMLFDSVGEVPDVGGVLNKYWVRRQVFIDPRVLLKELPLSSIENWLPDLYQRARSLSVFAIPVANLGTLEQMGANAFKASVSSTDELKFGLRIQSGDMTDRFLHVRVNKILADMGLTAKDCAVFADFSDADLSIPSLVSPIIRSVLEQLQTIGQWQLVVFQGTHFPETNPAQPGQTITQPRNEWRAWSEAVRFDPSTSHQMVFGDFAADSSKIEFGGKGGGRPIPHIRYATASNWLIVRGDEMGTTYEIMKDVFERIVLSGQFAGATFSEADAYIFDVARNNSQRAGGATTWRQLNTTHHITQIVADIAQVRRIPISNLPIPPGGSQQDLLDLLNI